MKKAYAKVKDNSVKSILKRPYIAVTILGASLCAIILSMSMSQEPLKEPNPEEQVMQVEVTAAPLPQTIPEKETEPVKEEVASPRTNEVSAPKPEEVTQPDTVSVAANTVPDKKLIMQKPVDGVVLKPYSNGKPVKNETMGDWRLHTGVDIEAAQGTEVKAVADGSVTCAEKDTLTGYTVTIDHGNGVLSTVYNLENIKDLKEGQNVKKGDKIGTAGASATLEMLDEPHIHFEVKENGKYINPETYLN